MILLLAVGCLVSAPVLAYEEVVETTQLEGIFDERVTYVPLGRSHIFTCQAHTKISHLVRTSPNWTVVFYNPDIQQFEREVVGPVRIPGNTRFRQLEDHTLLAVGLQKWHDGIVVECSLETGSSTVVGSRHKIAIQDCTTTKRNPCLYGLCGVHGFPDLFEAVHCNCSPQFTGDFCTEAVDGLVWRELFFFSPIILLCLLLAILYCFSNTVEFWGKAKFARLEKHLPNSVRVPDLKKLYHSAYLARKQIDRALQVALTDASAMEGATSKATPPPAQLSPEDQNNNKLLKDGQEKSNTIQDKSKPKKGGSKRTTNGLLKEDVTPKNDSKK